MKFFCIFGNPVKHSISPLMHNKIISYLGLNASYTKYLLKDPQELKSKIKSLKIDGANITVPHKEVAYDICDEVVGIAKDIKAVNTIVIRDTKLVGYNTDAPGFLESIKKFDNIKRVLILGAGGSARAISFILKQNNMDVVILNRSEGKLDFFKENDFECYSWDDFKISEFDLIINTTSAGLSEDILPLEATLLEQLFRDARFAVDIIYNKQTPFLNLACKSGLKIKDGADMLLYQGAIAFNIFYDNKFDDDTIIKEMREVFDY